MKKLHWIDAAKAFAIIGIVLNHLVEEFGAGPWFTNPSDDWPDLQTRLQHIFPTASSFPIAFIKFLGWLGDSGPGVFIILSGIGLTLSALKNESSFSMKEFYLKRLLRIFPLYIFIHFIIIAGLVIKQGGTFPFSLNTLLSFLGLRFNEQLFFYINPSWWFIWLILQMYIVFPFLFILLRKTGWQHLLWISFLFTFVCRGAGLAGIRYSEGLYYWMTGIFFGTRLAEFTLGMLLGYYLTQIQKGKISLPPLKRVLLFSLLSYIIGFGASLTWLGSIFSNLLVSAGLTGIFYCLWEGFFSKLHFRIGNLIMWLGLNSYALYLIHQPPLQWINYKFDGKIQLAVSFIWLAVSVFLSWFINQLIENRNFLKIKIISWKSMSVLSVLAMILIFAEGVYGRSNMAQRIYLLFLGSIFLLQLWYLYRQFEPGFLTKKNVLVYSGLLTLFLRLFILPDYHACFAVVISIALLLFFLLLNILIRKQIISVIAASLILLLLLWFAEKSVRKADPMEVGAYWGELPVLKKHPTRIYALKPDQNKVLAYNNYQYRVRTNSSGIAGPEISLQKDTAVKHRILVIGDAFSMPEGLDYESSYPFFLGKLFNMDSLVGRAEIINGGVTGYGPVEEVPAMDEIAAEFKPDIILYQFFINEFEEVHYTPEERLTYIGLIKPDLPLITQLANRSHLVEYLNRWRTKVVEYIVARPGDWRYTKTFLGFYEKGSNPLYDQQQLDTLDMYIYKMKEIAVKNEARLLIVFVPAAIAVTDQGKLSYNPWNINTSDTSRFDYDMPFRHLKDVTDKYDIPLLDLTSSLKKYPSQSVYFTSSWHWTKYGHEAAAFGIYDFLKQNGYIKYAADSLSSMNIH